MEPPTVPAPIKPPFTLDTALAKVWLFLLQSFSTNLAQTPVWGSACACAGAQQAEPISWSGHQLELVGSYPH